MTYWIAGTGTRKIQTLEMWEKALIFTRIEQFLQDMIDLHGDVGVISGMAEGFDKALAIVALHMGLPVVACVPNRGYGHHYWGLHSLTGKDMEYHFDHLLERVDEVEYADEFYRVRGLYKDGIHMNFWRNQRMVDRANHLLAYGTKETVSDGGTADCVKRGAYKRATNPDFEISFLAPVAA